MSAALRLACIALLSAVCGGTVPVAPQPTTSAALSSSVPVGTASTSTPTPPPSAVQLPALLQFVDARSGIAFFIETVGASRQKGTIAIRVPDRGVYLVEAGTALNISPTAVSVTYDGRAVLSPLVSFDGQTPRGIVKEPTDVRVKLQAQLDPVTRTGTATLDHDGVSISLDAQVPDVTGLAPVLDTLERAMLTNDARLLYSVVSTEATAQYTLDAFEKQVADQTALIGRTTAVRRGAVSAPALSEFGYWTVTVQYDTERRSPNGVTSPFRYEAYFIRQTVGWRILFTQER